MSNTITISRSVERYDETIDDYVEDDLEFSVIVHPSEPDVGLMQSYAEIDGVTCNGEEYTHKIEPRDTEAVELEAIQAVQETPWTPRHLRHLHMDL